jgi:hypothetical protein
MDTQHDFKEIAWLAGLTPIGSTTKQKHVTSTCPNIRRRGCQAHGDLRAGRGHHQFHHPASDLICVAMQSALCCPSTATGTAARPGNLDGPVGALYSTLPAFSMPLAPPCPAWKRAIGSRPGCRRHSASIFSLRCCP